MAMSHAPSVEPSSPRPVREPLVSVREKEYRELPISYLDRLLIELRESGASEPHAIVFRDAEAMTDRAIHQALDELDEHQTIRIVAGVFPGTFELVGLETDEINAAWSRLTAAMGTYRRAWRITVEPSIFWAATAFDEDGDWTERAGVMLVKVVWRGRQG